MEFLSVGDFIGANVLLRSLAAVCLRFVVGEISLLSATRPTKRGDAGL